MSAAILADRSDLHISRKIWHVVWGSLGMVGYFYFDLPLVTWGWVALYVSVVGFFIDFTRLKNDKFNSLIIKNFGVFMRRSEENNFSGLPFYALGMALSIFFYSEDIAILSILFLIFADPMASLVGVKFGKEMILPNKSLKGTLANFFTCYIITILYIINLEISALDMLIFATSAAIFGSVSELFSAFNVDDNITIPIGSGAGLTLVNIFVNVL